MSSDAEAANGLLTGKRGEGLPPGTTRAEERLVYAIVLYLGFCLLVSWNCVLNVISYFADMYHNDGISFYLTAAYTYPQLPVLLLVTMYGHRVSFTARIVVSLGAMAVLMAVMPLLAPYGMWYALVVMFLNGVATAVLQPSMMGFTSFFPPLFNQGVMFGQGVSGVATCVANIVVQVAMAGQQDAAAKVYFGVSAACIALGLVLYLYILRLPFVRFYVQRATAGAGGKDGALEDGGVDAAELGGDGGASSADGEGEGEGLVGGGAPSRLAVLRKVAPYCAAVFLVFTVTFTVFPGVAPFSIPFKGSWGPRVTISNAWWGIALLTAFNTFDTVGRFLPAVLVLLRGGRPVLAASVARAITIPAFVGAALRWAGWMDDTYVSVVMALFAITNGYFASLAMMQGPASVPPREREAAGFVMSLFLQAGIFAGSQVALVIQRVSGM